MKTFAALVVLLASVIHADVINTVSITCTVSAPGLGSTTESYSGSAMSGGCPLISIGENTSAASSFEENLGGTGSNSFAAGITADAQAYSGITGLAFVTQSIDLQLEFATAGPVRQGVIRFAADCDSDEGTLFASSSISVDGDSSCEGGVISVTLGENFPVELQTEESLSGGPGGLDGTGNSEEADMTLVVRVFEADGVTPVALEDSSVSAPEPASAALIGASLLLLACRPRK